MIAAIAVGLDVTSGPSSYRINAVYSSAPGLFPGAAVDVLGVPVGTVTSVTNVADKVEVGMELHSGARIPTAADASLVAPELLGQPDVDLNPGYTGGAYLRPGATIAESHTSVPVSTDQLLKQLQRTLKELNPDAVGNLVTNLSQDLDGQGAGLNQLIKSAAGTLQLLADKGSDLGQLNGTLAQLTGTLDSDTSQIEQLVREYDTVSSVVAQHSGQLNSALTELSGATTSLVTLLTPNLQPLEADVGTVTTVGRTLDRNVGNVDEILQQANNLFQGAQRVFDPTYNWLDLNLALPPGVTGDYVVGLIRDRLAGVCRRITANHSAGLSAAALASLASCGNPDSSFFDPLINDIPGILGTLSGPDGSSAGTALLQQGLDQIGSIGASSSANPGYVHGGTPERRLGQRRRHFRQRHLGHRHLGHRHPAVVIAVLDLHHDDDRAVVWRVGDHSGLPDRLLVAEPEPDPEPHDDDDHDTERAGRVALPGCADHEGNTPSDGAAGDGRAEWAVAQRAGSAPPSATALGPPPPAGACGAARPVGARCEELAVSARRRILLAVAGVLLGTATLAGCGGPGTPGPRTATAVFSDVDNLADGAQVQLAEIPIGRVTSIALEGDKAKVTMELSRSARIPANVTAALSQTTILGDQFIEMEVPKSDTHVGSGSGTGSGTSRRRRRPVPPLRNGAVIAHTTVVPDVEQLVQAGAQVFGSVSTTELEQIIAAGGEGFAGQEASLKVLLSDLSSVAATYAQHTSQFSTAINGMNQLTATLAPSSGATATALTTLVEDRGDPGAAVVAVRDAPPVSGQPLGTGSPDPRDVLPPDRHAAPGAGGGERSAQPEPGCPGRNPPGAPG